MKTKLPTKEHGGTRRGANLFFLRAASCPFAGKILLTCLSAALVVGCTSAPPTTQPLTEDQKQDQALEHPDEYKLDMHHDISGGGIGESRGLGTDIDHVLNP